MSQGEVSQPGERWCAECERRWYSAALLSDENAECPVCGGDLVQAPESD